MAIKIKTQNDILIQELKNLHPYAQGYVIDCLRKSVSNIQEELPQIFAQEKENQEKGVITMFHPNFYVSFVNQMNEVFDKIDLNYIKNYDISKVKDFKPTEKVQPYQD